MIDNDEVAAQVQDFLARQDAYFQAHYDWANGTATGGPNGDGYYPVPIGPGSTALKPCAERIQLDANKLNVQSIQLASGNSITLDASHNGKVLYLVGPASSTTVTVNLPGNVSAGWACTIIQQGTGRLIFAITNSGYLRQRQSFDRTAGQYAMATAVCVARDSGGHSTIVLGGDLATA